MMLGIFTSLKSRLGAAVEIEDRALKNWRTVFSGANIVVFEGALVPFRDMVKEVESKTGAGILMYANGDLIFGDDARGRIGNIDIAGDFLLTGQRIDILEDGAKQLHRPSGMDYFVFRRGMFHDLPKVWMGRGYCDSALVAYCLRRGIPVIDASFALRVEHQFHDYGHIVGGQNVAYQGAEAMENKRNNCLVDFGPNCLDATHTLLPDGRVVANIRKRPECWRLWHLLTRGGKYWKNPKWEGVEGI